MFQNDFYLLQYLNNNIPKFGLLLAVLEHHVFNFAFSLWFCGRKMKAIYTGQNKRRLKYAAACLSREHAYKRRICSRLK